MESIWDKQTHFYGSFKLVAGAGLLTFEHPSLHMLLPLDSWQSRDRGKEAVDQRGRIHGKTPKPGRLETAWESRRPPEPGRLPRALCSPLVFLEHIASHIFIEKNLCLCLSLKVNPVASFSCYVKNLSKPPPWVCPGAASLLKNSLPVIVQLTCISGRARNFFFFQ